MESSTGKLFRQGIHLEIFTITYNLIEAAASILFGKIAGSIALVGFGLDSIIESLSGFILLWRLRAHGRVSPREEVRLEERASRFVGWTFFILGAYVLFESAKKLITRDIPDPSIAGVIIAAVSLIVMPVLAFKKSESERRSRARHWWRTPRKPSPAPSSPWHSCLASVHILFPDTGKLIPWPESSSPDFSSGRDMSLSLIKRKRKPATNYKSRY